MDRPMMDRRTFLGASGFSVLGAPLAVEAQQAAKVPRMGWLGNLGWVEDQHMVTEWRFSGGRAERFPALADELVALKVDVIVTPGTPAIPTAEQVTRTRPIVLANVGDPVTSGLVTSLARSGGNISGLSVRTPDLVTKALAILKEPVPLVSRVAEPLGDP